MEWGNTLVSSEVVVAYVRALGKKEMTQEQKQRQSRRLRNDYYNNSSDRS